MTHVVGVVLAAGRATRFDGGDKLLAHFEGEALVHHAARRLTTAAIAETVAVVADDAVAEALADLPVERLANPDPAAGMSRSVAIGAAFAADAGATGAAFLPGDMPCVAPTTVDRLLEAHAAEPGIVIVPEQGGRRGNPVVFPAGLLERLQRLDGDVGGRALLETVPTTRVAVDDPGVHVDVDTREDLLRLRQSGCAGTRP
ncbi:MAG: NTP transferase domain-containing protein [Halobacteriales archaeon]